jgi:vacuole morphology and inheritance protein 14
LEAFLYDQIKDDNDDYYIKYILNFRSLSESSHLINERKGALLGYYSIVNVIKRICKEKGVEICHTKLLDELMKCLKISLKDNDNKIILSAAQCIYNIMVEFNQYVLMNFNDFFDGLLTLVTIDDLEIKNIAENLDSSLKGVINYSFQGKLPEDFNLLEFFKKIILNISLENPANKSTVVSWISSINQIPGIKLINILYLFLGELFDMLQINNPKVQEITNECLKDFYNEIENDFEDIAYNIKIKILEIVIQKCEKNKPEERNVKLKAFKWANLFLRLYKFLFIRMANNQKQNELKKKAISQDITDNSINTNNNDNTEDNEKKKGKEEEDSNESDDNKKFPFDLFTKFLRIIFNTLKDSKEIKDYKKMEKKTKNNNNNNNNGKNNTEDLYEIINNCNNCLLTIIEKYNMNRNNIKQLEEVLMEYLFYENNELLLTIIKWIDQFFNKFCEEAFNNNFNKFIENFAFIATYKDQEIFETGIKTLCNIEKCRNGSINVIIKSILNKLKEKDNNFALKRLNDFVIVLCKELNVKHVYKTFAMVLSEMDKSNFICKIINILNMHLLTSNETRELRNLLKNIQKTSNEEDKKFFEKLFSVWCVNPVSCLILCLIAEDFELSFHLLNKFGSIKLNQENYFEYAQLVPVIESKEFISKKTKYLIFFYFRFKIIFITAKKKQIFS